MESKRSQRRGGARIGALTLVLLTGALGAWGIAEAAWYGQCENCPSGYRHRVGPFNSEAQCRNIDRRLQVRCWEEGGSSGGGMAGTDLNSIMMQQMQGALGSVFFNLGQALGQALVGGLTGPTSDPGPSAAYEQQRQQEIQRQRQAIEEELARQEAYRREQKRLADEAFQRDKDRTYSMFKGPKVSDTFRLKGAGDSAELGIKDVKSAASAQTRWNQVYCSDYLLKKAQAAGARGDRYEADYLNGQAKKVITGERSEVACPKSPNPPSESVTAKMNSDVLTALQLGRLGGDRGSAPDAQIHSLWGTSAFAEQRFQGDNDSMLAQGREYFQRTRDYLSDKTGEYAQDQGKQFLVGLTGPAGQVLLNIPGAAEQTVFPHLDQAVAASLNPNTAMTRQALQDNDRILHEFPARVFQDGSRSAQIALNSIQDSSLSKGLIRSGVEEAQKRSTALFDSGVAELSASVLKEYRPKSTEAIEWAKLRAPQVAREVQQYWTTVTGDNSDSR